MPLNIPRRYNYWKQVVWDKKHPSCHHYVLKCVVWQGAHICFPPCLNKCRRRALLLWQRACQHSWPQPESWLPLSLAPPLSNGWRRSRNTPRCSGGSAHHSHQQHRPEGRHTQNRLGNWELWEIVSRLYMRYRLFHIHFVHRNAFIFKLTSSWAWTIVSTSALTEPVCQVQKKDDVFLLNKHHYLCPCSSFSCKHYPQSLQADMRAFSDLEQHNFQLRSAISNDIIPWATWRLWIGVVHSYCNLHTT